MNNIFICPVCNDKFGADKAPQLCRKGNTLRCKEGHCFDISAKGYVNLLLSQNKNVKDPGDSKEMVAARREFLNSGAYKPLCEGICEEISSLSSENPTIADCGCGEGYYTAAVYDYLVQTGKSPEVFGVDISKNALSAAHARISQRQIFCAAASVFHLPILSQSVDIAAVIFAPFHAAELRRILKLGGVVVTAIPAARHLYGLKKVLYANPYENEVKPYEIEGFEFLGKREISYTLKLDSQSQLNALFMMTPYFYKTSREDSTHLYSFFGTNAYFETEISFEILKYRLK